MPGPGIELIGEDEIAEVMQVLTNRSLSRYGREDDPAFGAKVLQVEQQIAALAGVRFGLGLSGGGSSGLLVSLMGLGVGPGDEVIVPGFTFVASISAIVYARGLPVLAEVDDSFNLDPVDVEARITPRTKAIIVVHMLGAPARLDEIKDVADRHGIALIEDCAQAFGATYQGQGVGGIGSTGVYSFNEYKTITCGDGGMIVTDDEDLYGRLFAIHDQGHAPNRLGSKYAERPFLGLNFRMTELSGAVLLAQVRKLDMIRTHLRENKQIVKSAIEDLPGHRLPRDRRPRRRPGHAPGRDVPVGRDRRGGRHGARLDHPGRVRLARVLEHGAPRSSGGPSAAAAARSIARATAMAQTDYRAGTLPKTDALLARSMSIGIGVSDANLAPFGLRMRDDAAAARAVAERFRDVAGPHLGG